MSSGKTVNWTHFKHFCVGPSIFREGTDFSETTTKSFIGVYVKILKNEKSVKKKKKTRNWTGPMGETGYGLCTSNKFRVYEDHDLTSGSTSTLLLLKVTTTSNVRFWPNRI